MIPIAVLNLLDDACYEFDVTDAKCYACDNDAEFVEGTATSYWFVCIAHRMNIRGGGEA